ncbi:MAG TPA: nucleoside deaminase [Candidatus Merdivicinus faecavium]|nr:nucleoside deaminase [Candidatus Merdivicinus faecavium]
MATRLQDEEYMRLALAQARLAAAQQETPIGAVLVWEGEVVAAAYNRRELDKRAIAHAEILAIDEACRKLGGWRLHKATLYVTLEPCPMCAGAIINARVKRVVYGAPDRKAGCCGSVTDLFREPFNHHPEVTGGVLAEESAALLTSFFKRLRSV